MPYVLKVVTILYLGSGATEASIRGLWPRNILLYFEADDVDEIGWRTNPILIIDYKYWKLQKVDISFQLKNI